MICIARTHDEEELDAWGGALTALGFDWSSDEHPELGFRIWVQEADEGRARAELTAASEERSAFEAREDRRRELDRESLGGARAWTTAAFASALLLAAHALADGLRPEVLESWRHAGANVGALTAHGQPWRAITALTLHSSWEHVLSNALFGAVVATWVCSSWGGGFGIFLILLGGAFGNFTESLISSGNFATIGASTAVFSALGIVAGTRLHRGSSRNQVFLVTGATLALFAYFGLGGAEPGGGPSRVDTLAHALGLAWGGALGLLTRRALHARPGEGAQWLFGALSVLLLFASWFCVSRFR